MRTQVNPDPTVSLPVVLMPAEKILKKVPNGSKGEFLTTNFLVFI